MADGVGCGGAAAVGVAGVVGAVGVVGVVVVVVAADAAAAGAAGEEDVGAEQAEADGAERWTLDDDVSPAAGLPEWGKAGKCDSGGMHADDSAREARGQWTCV